MFRFVGKPERSVDLLSRGTTETVRIWFYFGMFFLPEGASDEAMGHHAILHSQGPRHAKMVGSTRAIRGRATTTLFLGLFQVVDQEFLVVDDYGYVGIDFRNDPDLVLPKGDEWDAALGKKKYA